MSDYINHFENGFLVSNVNEAADVLKTLLLDLEVFKNVSEACIKKADEFSPEILVNQYEGIFLQLH
jgi:glycosyltransferase involved in cell wall biosynthesis